MKTGTNPPTVGRRSPDPDWGWFWPADPLAVPRAPRSGPSPPEHPGRLIVPSDRLLDIPRLSGTEAAELTGQQPATDHVILTPVQVHPLQVPQGELTARRPRRTRPADLEQYGRPGLPGRVRLTLTTKPLHPASTRNRNGGAGAGGTGIHPRLKNRTPGDPRENRRVGVRPQPVRRAVVRRLGFGGVTAGRNRMCENHGHRCSFHEVGPVIAPPGGSEFRAAHLHVQGHPAVPHPPPTRPPYRRVDDGWAAQEHSQKHGRCG
ncbi:hypothetical protein SSCG_03264 [Streptomyces clavuligerus]|nr:hypothetical protein SSCG_03264 [Streptomyces clavuligerus]